MKKLIFVLTLTALMSACAFAQEDNDRPAPPPPPKSAADAGILVALGGRQTPGAAPKKVKGKLRIMLILRGAESAKTAEVFVDNKSVGKMDKAPWYILYDGSGLTVGEHKIKGVALDAEGNEVFNEETTVNVVAKDEELGRPKPPSLPKPPVKPDGDKPAPPDGKVAPPDEKPLDGPGAVKETKLLDKIYKADKYGFSVLTSSAWKVTDETAKMKPKKAGECRLVFDGKAKDGLVVNIRRTKLQPGTNGEKFAKYNTYVKDWDKMPIGGCDAFVTTQGTPAEKNVVQRAIILKGGYAYMMNCADTSGKDVDFSADVFSDIICSLK